MRAIKKINNNVALCVDGKGTELIAFGKGIGFSKMPYEVALRDISMTFYRIDQRFYALLTEIPSNVFEVTALIVRQAQSILAGELNPNLVVSLADHINFAIQRLQKYKEIKMVFSYDVEQLYPEEADLGRYAVQLIRDKLLVVLPDSEITSIAMHFVNAEANIGRAARGEETEAFLEDLAVAIEQELAIRIDRQGFNYNRFAMHMRYCLKRIQDKAQFQEDDTHMLQLMREEYPDLQHCTARLLQKISDRLQEKLTAGEELYLMLHINRLRQNSIENH